MNLPKTAKVILVLLSTIILAVSNLLMIGPQLIIIAGAAMIVGLFLVWRRSFLSLVCFGYPLTFGLVSALIGSAELDDYVGSRPFAVSIGIGVFGVALMATGFAKSLRCRD